MKLSEEFKKAMRDPKATTFGIELTPERKQRYQRICMELIDWMVVHTDTPFEAYMILQFCTESIKSMHGIESGIMVKEDDHGNA